MKLYRWLVALLLIAFGPYPADARDGWQGRPSVCGDVAPERRAACQQWVASVKQPDNGTVCCGDGDFYFADDFDVDPKTGAIHAIISEDYPDVKRGTRILVPAQKENNARIDGNPTGHGVIAMRLSDDPEVPSQVYCHFKPAGT